MERRIRISALLTSIGLVVALISLLIPHPLAFVMFLGIGVTLVVIGVIYYLVSLVREPTPPTAPAAPPGTRSGNPDIAKG